MWAGGCNLGLPSSSFALRPDSPAPLYRTNGGWLSLAVVSSADGLYAIELWRGCSGTSALAWGPFWPPMPRLTRLLLPRPPGEGGVWFP